MKTLILLLLASSVYAIEPFYVYKDKGSKENKFCPSGWMGSYSEIKFNDGFAQNCKEGTCVEIKYAAQKDPKWAGIYWQNPCQNWGTRDGGYNMNAYEKVTFWAKGEKDKAGLYPRIEEFKIGGITGEYGDSASASMGPIELTGEWQKYTIKLNGLELSKISGGFAWSATADYNAEGITFYLDEVRYE